MIESLVAGPNFDGLRRAIFVSIAGRFFAPELPSNLRKISSDGRNVVLEVLLARLPTRTLAEISSITKGRTGIKDAIPGKFPLVVTAEARGSSDHFDFEGPAVIIPTVSSTGHGDASLKRVHFQDGQYAVGSILAVVQPKAPDQISARFLHTYLSAFKDELLVSRMVGTANVSLTVAKIGTVPVPLLPIAAQRKVDELMALCDRLETRQSDAQAAHARLVDELLGSLLQARDAEDFAECWGRVKGSFDVLFTTEQSVDRLKQALVELAVMGKIVEQDPADEHADELANRLIAAKSLATADARKQKELTAETLPPFDAPNGWAWKKLDDLLQISGGVTLGRKFGDKALVSKPYLRVANVQRGHLDLNQVKEVDIPEDEIDRYVLRAGDLLITEGGDWDKVGRTCIWNDELAECLHQNHIFRARSESDEFFVRWAELYLNSAPARDYFAGSSKQTTNLASINMTQLRSCAFPLPPLAEQRRIVAKVDALMALCDRVKIKVTQTRKLSARLAGTFIDHTLP